LDQLDNRVCQDLQVKKVLLDHLGKTERMDMWVLQDQQGLQDHLVLKEPRGSKVTEVLQEHLEIKVKRAPQDLLVIQGRRELWVNLVMMETLDLLDHLELLEKRQG
ncbi:hypothetical protein cypCar_00014016, partial [Cyprinus carpio]